MCFWNPVCRLHRPGSTNCVSLYTSWILRLVSDWKLNLYQRVGIHMRDTLYCEKHFRTVLEIIGNSFNHSHTKKPNWIKIKTNCGGQVVKNIYFCKFVPYITIYIKQCCPFLVAYYLSPNFSRSIEEMYILHLDS